MTELVDWNFVGSFEGDWAKGYVPNIKNDKGRIGSGTSIISGLDLGQHDEAYVRRLKLKPELTEKLLPFCGKTGPSAVMSAQARFEGALEALNRLNHVSPSAVGRMGPTGVRGDGSGPGRVAKAHETPTQFIADRTVLALELTPTERHELTVAVRSSYYEDIASHFNQRSRGKRFGSLPREVQTALVSLHWHMGSIWGPHHAARDVFQAAIHEDWRSAVDNLRGGEVYSAPRYFKFRTRRRAEAELIRKGEHIPADYVGPKEQEYKREYMERVYRIGSLKARTA